ncbi:hypothetical protein V1280_003869 [Bradyrhizobium sp. AZCC 2230]
MPWIASAPGRYAISVAAGSLVSLPLRLPGINVSVSPTDYSTYDTFKLAKFDGKTWKFFGENLSTASR